MAFSFLTGQQLGQSGMGHGKRDLVRLWMTEPPLRPNHLIERRVVNKGGGLPQLRELRVIESRLKICPRCPLGDVDKTETGLGVETTMQPRRDISFLALHAV